MSWRTRELPNSGSGTSRPFLISFSGIDGAGKTTQIERLSACLEQQGLRVLRLSFWDDIAVWPGVRTAAGDHALDFYQKGRPAADLFTPRNHKHIQRWYLTVARSGLYALDVLHLHRVLARSNVRCFDVVIFDRYIYDQIANIDSRSRLGELYRRILVTQSPSPDLAFILDASPALAFARKPEYPLEFVYRNRRTFLRLHESIPQLITIPEGEVQDVEKEIYGYICRSRLGLMAANRADTVVGATSAVGPE